MRSMVMMVLIGVWMAIFASGAKARNLIENPNFADGSTSFITGYSQSSDQNDPGKFVIGNNPNQYNSNWSNQIAPYSGNMMMIVNGATTPNTIIWENMPVKVKPHTKYYLEVYATSLFAASPPILVFRINGVQAGNNDLLSAPPGQWTEFYVAWNSGTAKTASVSIVDQNTEAYGNDFALGDISLDTSFLKPDDMKFNPRSDLISFLNPPVLGQGG